MTKKKKVEPIGCSNRFKMNYLKIMIIIFSTKNL